MEENIKIKTKIDQIKITKSCMKIKSNTNEPMEETEYAASYLKTGIMRGITYQLKLLTWVSWKLTYTSDINTSNWWLAAEVRYARGFHDLILRYVNNTPNVDDSTSNGKYLYRFVQIKHKTKVSEIAKISVGHLMSQKHAERQYSLIYLFRSYLNMREKFEHITSDQIVDLTVFTNKDIGELQFLIPVKKDNIFDFEGKGKRYRVDLNRFQIDSRMLKCLRQISPNDTLIFDFLKKLIFAVDQPSEPELEKLIVEDMGKFYNYPQIFYNDLYKNIIEWFLIYNDGKALYLTEKHVTRHLRNTHDILLKAKDTEILSIKSVSKLTDKIPSLSI